MRKMKLFACVVFSGIFCSSLFAEELPGSESVVFTEPVAAHFSGRWFFDNGSRIRPVAFSGREDFRHARGEDGADLPPRSEVRLIGDLIAEEDGEAAIGVGADWWWIFSVNGKEVTGRHPAMPEGNLKSTFRKTDWSFLVPVHQGTNRVELAVILGETGLVSIGLAEKEVIAQGFSQELNVLYKFYSKNFPPPESVPFKPRLSWDGTIRFRTAQPFSAGVEYRLGDGEWHQVWDDRPSRFHRVWVPLCPWMKCVYRPIQRIYHGGWQIVRGEEREWERTNEG